MTRQLIGWLAAALTALVVGAWIGALMLKDPGYVLIAYDRFSVETSFWVGAALWLLSFLALWIVFSTLRRVLPMRRLIAGWRSQRRIERARRMTLEGMTLLAEGQFARAKKQLTAAANDVEHPLLNLLSAARAAQGAGDTEERDRFLAMAAERAPESTMAIGLTRAELLLESGQYESAAAGLLKLRNTAPDSVHLLRLSVRAHQHLNDFDGLAAMLPSLLRLKALPIEELEALEGEVYAGQLRAVASKQPDREVVETLWKSLPKGAKRRSELVLAYAESLLAVRAADAAEEALREALDREWSEPLAARYGEIPTDLTRQSKVAEKWLTKHAESPALLLTLGRLAMRSKEWVVARERLTASYRLQANADTAIELARVLTELGEHEQAAQQLLAMQERNPAPL